MADSLRLGLCFLSNIAGQLAARRAMDSQQNYCPADTKGHKTHVFFEMAVQLLTQDPELHINAIF